MHPHAKMVAGAFTLLFGCAADAPVRGTPPPVPVADAAEPVTTVVSPDAGSIATPFDAAISFVDASSVSAPAPDSGAAGCNNGMKQDVDIDGDGFTVAAGDCDDCLKTVNPAAYDVPGNAVDEDCSGNAATADLCEQGLTLASIAAEDGARAVGLCSFPSASSKAWGVIAARYTDASGLGTVPDPLQTGILPGFGAAKPRAGTALLALSSGVARAPDQPGYTRACDWFGDFDCNPWISDCVGVSAAPPPGYPKNSSVCANQGFFPDPDPVVFNQAALELKVRVPSNANAFSFESIFYTSEYPDWICEVFNDFFVVFMEPKPAGASDGNLVFDANKDPIGVNTGLLAVCDPSAQSRRAVKTFTCDQGVTLLAGTGYGRLEGACGDRTGGASTGWLKTTAPVTPGQVITLRFAIWDTMDSDLDSTALIDNFKWITFEGTPEKKDDVPVVTEPVLL